MKTIWYLYIIRTASALLYTGITTDPSRRLQQHQSGRGAKFLRGRGPLQMVYLCPIGESRAAAQRAEYRIKQLSRIKKLSLVEAQPVTLCQWLN